MRLEAYKMCLHVLSEDPMSGVGSDHMEHRIQKAYVQTNSSLFNENRIGPHNQFLEYGVKYGLLGIVYLIIFFGYYLIEAMKNRNYAILALVLLLLISAQFESLLERQVSIFLIAGILPMAENLFFKEN